MQLRPSVSASDLQSFLGAPEQLLQQPVELQLAVASFADTPRSLLEVLVNSPSEEVAEAASLHVNWAGEITDWQCAVDEILQSRQIGQNDRLAVELLKVGAVPPCFLSKWVPPERLIQGLRNPYMPLRYRLQLLERLAQEPTLEPRLQVAEAPETPLSVLEQLAGDLELPVRLAVKFNPCCPPQLIELVEGQHAVASNWNTNKEELAMLGQSRWAWIRLAVAQNPNASAETLMELAQDAVYKIQLAVAKNPATAADVLAVLAEHPDKTIQETVAEHPNVSEELLHQVFPTQKHILKKRNNLPASILERYFNEAPSQQPIWKNNQLRYLFLEQPNTPTWILAELANVDLEALRADILAKHQNSRPSPEVLEKWIQDNIRFLADVAKHPQVSVEILERLSQYPNPYVQLTVAQNDKISESLQIHLLEQLINNANKDVCYKIASNTNTPVSILERIASELTPINQVTETLFSLIPVDATSLLAKIRDFVNNRQAPEIILFWLRQDAAFRQPILEEWNQLLASLDEPENQALQHLAQIAGMFAGKQSRKDVQWLGENPFNADGTFSSNYILYGLLTWSNSAFNSDNEHRSIALALIKNPNTPLPLREQLQNQIAQPPDSTGSYKHDSDMRLAVAFNPQTPEQQRIEYLQQALSSGLRNIQETIAKNHNTPIAILEQIAQRNAGGIQDVVRNPNVPVNILRQAVQQNNSYTLRLIAENPNTPVDLLEELALNQTSEVRDTALKNPSLDNLTVYAIKLKLQAREELQEAHRLMARRLDSPYALAQVLEQGDQKAKLYAARSQKTPTFILEQLAKDSDEIVRSVVAENPNLPLSTLLELTQDTNVNIRVGLARKRLHQKLPVEVLERLANDESQLVRKEIAANTDTPVELLRMLANDSSPEVLNALTRNHNTPVDILEFLGVEKGIVNVWNSNTPGNALEKAVEKTLNMDFRFRDEALDKLLKPVQGSQMPAHVLAELVTYKTSWVRSSVAAHPNTPISALAPLINDDYSPVLWAIARRADTPEQLLEQLLQRKSGSRQDYQQICIVISERREIPPNLLRRLLNSNVQQIDLRVAAQQNLPQAIIERLINTSNESTLITLARNQSLEAEFLEQLAQHPNANVCRTIINHPNMTQSLWLQLAQHTAVSVRHTIAGNSNTPINILEMLAADLDKDVRASAGTNNNTPVKVLEQLAQDEDAFVRTAVASNPNLPATTLEQLANDEKVEVRRAVAQNSNTPASIRETLRDLIPQPTTLQTSPTLRGLSRIYNPSTDDLPTVLTEYAQSENAFVRFIALLHPLTPQDILNEGTKSASWLERYAVADNPATSTQIKQQLTKDNNRIVRAAVIANL